MDITKILILIFSLPVLAVLGLYAVIVIFLIVVEVSEFINNLTNKHNEK